MANAHSAIDSLIANATLQRYQEGGPVSREEKLRGDIKSLFEKRSPYREKAFLPEDDEKRINALARLAAEHGVEGFRAAKIGRSRYNPFRRSISVEMPKHASWGSSLVDDMHVPYDTIEENIIAEIAHGKQHKENTPVWKKGTRNPLHLAGFALGQPLFDIASRLDAPKLQKAAEWMAGYSRPKSLEHEAHQEIEPQLFDFYLKNLRSQGVGDAMDDYLVGAE